MFRSITAIFARAFAAFFALVALFALGCGRSSPQPANTGPRIVALSPALAMLIADLGHADVLVGRHGFDRFTSPSVPVCGDQAGLDYEALVRARPTLVLTQWGARELPPRLIELSRTMGFDVVDFRMLTLDDIPAALNGIDQRLNLGLTSPSPRARELLNTMNRAWSRRPGLSNAGRVLLLASANPPAALGPGSFHAQVLERLGATPAIKEGSPFIELHAEDILRLAPDAIVLIAPRPHAAPPAALEPRAALGTIADLATPAARLGRFAVIDDPDVHTPGTPMIHFADELGALLEAWSKPGTPPGPGS